MSSMCRLIATQQALLGRSGCPTPLHRPLALFWRGLREVRITEKSEKETVVECVDIDSGRTPNLINPDLIPTTLDNEDVLRARNRIGQFDCPSPECHPLCRLPFVHKIKHTDVLILAQFMQKDGHIMHRSVTGLCKRQQLRIDKLIRMAHKAGLFPESDVYANEKEKMPYTRLNSYWDEKTIDIQWLQRRKQDRINSFRK